MTLSLDGAQLILESKEVGKILAYYDIPVPQGQGRVCRFSARVDVTGVCDAQGATQVNPYLENNAQDRVCLTLAQYDAAGLNLSEVSCQPVLGTHAGKQLMLEAWLQPEAVSLRLQCRAIDVKGKAAFSQMEFACLPLATLQTMPQVRVIAPPQGGIGWEVNGERLALALYFGNNQFGCDDVILDEMNKAVSAGVRVISFNLALPSNVSLDALDAVLDRFVTPHPGVYFLPRVWMQPVWSWCGEHPGERMKYADGSSPNMPSSASQAWAAVAQRGLDQLIEHIRASRWAGQFIGTIPCYYQTGEWIVWEPDKSAGYDEPTARAFGDWAHDKYGSLDKLNRAWGSSLASFDQVCVPTQEERNAAGLVFFRDPLSQRREIDYCRFYNELIPGMLDELARSARQAGDGRGLTGYFYGYTMEIAWSDVWPQQTGHLGLARLLDSAAVDFYGSSYSYNFDNRFFGYPADPHTPFDSARLHGKLAFLEEDTYTHIARKPSPDLLAPGEQHQTKNLEQTLGVLRRNLGVATAHGLMMHWQNLLSDGRFNLTEIWEMYGQFYKEMAPWEARGGAYRPQVAVVVDEQSYDYLKVNARDVYGRWVYETRSALARVDVSAGYYLQSDLDKIPDSVRCLVLLTPYCVSAEQQTALRERWMTDGRTVVWCYLPNWFGPGGSRLTGMKLALHTDMLDIESQASPEGWLAPFAGERFASATDFAFRPSYPDATHGPLSPWLSVEDEQTMALAQYCANGKISCAVKMMDGWQSVYLGAHLLTPPMWREVFKRAGCHLYLDQLQSDWKAPDVVQANDWFLMVQSGREGTRRVNLPRRCQRVFALEAQGLKEIAQDTDGFEAHFSFGQPRFFVFE